MSKSTKELGCGALVCALFLLCCTGGYQIISSIRMTQDCTGHLKRAADSNTIELAQKELKTALQYLENKELTTGYTSVIYRTPDEDIGFWYDNLKASLDELDQIIAKKEVTQLEKSNILMKLRETLIDHEDSGTHVTKPKGVAWYPHNALLGILNLIGALALLISGAVVIPKN